MNWPFPASPPKNEGDKPKQPPKPKSYRAKKERAAKRYERAAHQTEDAPL